MSNDIDFSELSPKAAYNRGLAEGRRECATQQGDVYGQGFADALAQSFAALRAVEARQARETSPDDEREEELVALENSATIPATDEEIEGNALLDASERELWLKEPVTAASRDHRLTYTKATGETKSHFIHSHHAERWFNKMNEHEGVTNVKVEELRPDGKWVTVKGSIA